MRAAKPSLPVQPLDAACEALRQLADERGLDAIEVTVRRDGRAEVRGQCGHFTKWVSRSNVGFPGDATPSASLAKTLLAQVST